MNPIYHLIYGQRPLLKANTFIGGVAKLGGEGVNAPINTPALLAVKLNLTASDIKNFRVIGDDIQCLIETPYRFITYAFGGGNPASANQNLTYYIDNDGLANSVYTETFVSQFAFGYCESLHTLILPGAKIGHTAFVGYNAVLRTLDLSSFVRCGGQILRNCPVLENVDLPVLSDHYGNTSMMAFMTGLKTANLPLLNRGGGNFFNSNTSLEYCNIKKIKEAFAGNAFLSIKMGAVIDANIAMKTIVDGQPDTRLLYAKNTRNAIVNLYDDNGNFIETL